MLKKLVVAAILGVSGLFATAASADTVVKETVVVEVVAPVPPPQLPVETVVIVRPGFVFHRSFWWWSASEGRWILRPGFYVPVRAGWRWYGPRYVHRTWGPRRGWIYVAGGWRR